MPLPQGAVAHIRKTAHHPFFQCTPEQESLFSVREGIPTKDALEQAACFLISALAVVREAAEEANTDSFWTSVYLISVAQAVVDSAVESIYAEERSATSQGVAA